MSSELKLNHTPDPREWFYSPNMSAILCPSATHGERSLLDVRGWGYLTGKGHGALGLSNEEAVAEQDALAAFVIDACRKAAAAPEATPPAREEVLEEAALLAERVGRPVGAGDGDTYVPGTSADAAQAIRALKSTPPASGGGGDVG